MDVAWVWANVNVLIDVWIQNNCSLYIIYEYSTPKTCNNILMHLSSRHVPVHMKIRCARRQTRQMANVNACFALIGAH